jgi:hypothetical protein
VTQELEKIEQKRMAAVEAYINKVRDIEKACATALKVR